MAIIQLSDCRYEYAKGESSPCAVIGSTLDVSFQLNAEVKMSSPDTGGRRISETGGVII